LPESGGRSDCLNFEIAFNLVPRVVVSQVMVLRQRGSYGVKIIGPTGNSDVYAIGGTYIHSIMPNTLTHQVCGRILDFS
jgi:hypothetical protein